MITIDPADPTPPFEQLRRGIGDQVRTGALEPGHRLPSVRQLAGDLGLAPGTVARAYAELEAEGLIEASRAGTRVRSAPPLLPEAARMAARAYIAALGGTRVSLEDALRAVRAEWG